ncbi:hypothetical protein FQP88_12230 [Vibrio atlanticus]|nr:hypothetical protein FQP88_12230 [Vibrio atlanticus]
MKASLEDRGFTNSSIITCIEDYCQIYVNKMSFAGRSNSTINSEIKLRYNNTLLPAYNFLSELDDNTLKFIEKFELKHLEVGGEQWLRTIAEYYNKVKDTSSQHALSNDLKSLRRLIHGANALKDEKYILPNAPVGNHFAIELSTISVELYIRFYQRLSINYNNAQNVSAYFKVIKSDLEKLEQVIRSEDFYSKYSYGIDDALNKCKTALINICNIDKSITYCYMHKLFTLAGYDLEEAFTKGFDGKSSYYPFLYEFPKVLWIGLVEQSSNLPGWSITLQAQALHRLLTQVKEIHRAEYQEAAEQGLCRLLEDDINGFVFECIKSENDAGGLLKYLQTLNPTFSRFINPKYSIPLYGMGNNDEVLFVSVENFYYLKPSIVDEIRTRISEICEMHENNSKSLSTISSDFQGFIKSFNFHIPNLNDKEKELMRKYGLAGIIKEDFYIYRNFLAKVKARFTCRELAYNSARNINSKFRWAVGEILRTDTPNVYSIHTLRNKAQEHNSDPNNKMYSEEECAELYFYIEKILDDEKTTKRGRCAATIGKVILQTAWNLQPTLDLTKKSITKRVNPLTNKEEFDIRLLKNRRKYKTSRYGFNPKALSERDTRSALTTIINYRKEVSDHFDSDYVFLYEMNGQIKRESPHVLRYLSGRLLKAGCSIRFNSHKVRKGGMNYIYRRVAKTVKQHEGFANHSFETFLKYYLQINTVQSKKNMSDAAEVMSDYFSGKEVTQDINLLPVKEMTGEQETPSGVCSAPDDSKEVVDFSKKHRLIDKYCGDYLACVWCKFFKIILDADHVWKLLSYKEYVLFDMERSIGDFEEIGEQRDFVRILTQRVDYIIEHVREKKPDIVKDAFTLIKNEGIHPDWSMILPEYFEDKS